jgi:hypothetical protein
MLKYNFSTKSGKIEDKLKFGLENRK